jgi:S-adenosylmethionine hydrolase
VSIATSGNRDWTSRRIAGFLEKRQLSFVRRACTMIVLFTDFGLTGPYVGQVKGALCRDAPDVPIIDLIATAPAHDPKAASYLLAACVGVFPPGTVFFAVVDPGVGGRREPGVVAADGRWFVGPMNGLFEAVIRRSRTAARWWRIEWRPSRLSSTFHGRDLFAPVAARIANGESPAESPDYKEFPLDQARFPDWPDDLDQVVFIDDFGNAMTGRRAATVPPGSKVSIAGRDINQARTFGDVPAGEVFWYENSNGLLEISVNRGRAATSLNLVVGSQVGVRKK